jgi:transcriptional regulator with XRE-family HTH domain
VGRRVGTNVERKHHTPDQALGAVITQLRMARNWSHAEMGHRVGYSERHINAVELGTASPTHRMLVAAAQVFGLRASQLLARAERLYVKHEKKRSATRRNS